MMINKAIIKKIVANGTLNAIILFIYETIQPKIGLVTWINPT